MNSDVASLYEFCLLQTVAESYLPTNLLDSDAVKEALRRGNNRFGYPNQCGMSRLTDAQSHRWSARGHFLPFGCAARFAQQRTHSPFNPFCPTQSFGFW